MPTGSCALYTGRGPAAVVRRERETRLARSQHPDDANHHTYVLLMAHEEDLMILHEAILT